MTKTQKEEKEIKDLTRRNFFKLALLSLSQIQNNKVSGNPNSIHTDKTINFISDILGSEIDTEQLKRIKEILAKLRRNATSFPLEKIVDYLQLIPNWLYNRLPKKIKKSVLIVSKFSIQFPYYCDEKNWEKINYTGRFIGKKGLKRYDDPKIDVVYPDRDEISFDVCIIGSGAGGSIAGISLADKGSVCILERGKLIKPSEFTEKEEEMIPKLYRFSTDKNLSIITAYGNCVGGSTVHNTALFVKLPEKIYDYWRYKGLPIRKDIFYELQEKVFEIVKAEKIDSLNTNNLKIKEGIEKAGLNSFVPHHSRKDCLKVGFCELGCFWNRKFSTLTHIIPEFLKKGGVIFPETRTIYLERSGQNEIKYALCKHKGRKIKIKAKHFILSAGAMSSPILLKKSGILNPQGVCLHPATYVMGVFDEDIYSWLGIPISVICSDFLREDGGFVLMPYTMHPGMFSVALGGKGKEHFETMKKYKKIALIAVMLHDKPKGKLEEGKLISINYQFTKEEIEEMKKGIYLSSNILFEAGAKEVILPSVFYIQKAKNLSEVKNYLENLDIENIPFLSVHPQATIRWNNYLEEDGKIKGIKNLYVADSSVFPESCGVPPQTTVMSIALHIAQNIG